MKKTHNNNDLLGLSAIVLGLILVIWGISYFIFPAFLVIIGFMLLSFGLRKRNLPPLKTWILRIITRLR